MFKNIFLVFRILKSLFLIMFVFLLEKVFQFVSFKFFPKGRVVYETLRCNNSVHHGFGVLSL